MFIIYLNICTSAPETNTQFKGSSGQLSSRDPAIQSPIKIKSPLIVGCITFTMATQGQRQSGET